MSSKEKPLKRKRVSVSLDPEMAEMLEAFAEKDYKTPTTKALEYIQQGLEEEEDKYWSEVADKACQEYLDSGQKTYSLEQVWNECIGSDIPKELKENSKS